MAVRVCVFGRKPLLREGLALALDDDPDVHVAGVAGDIASLRLVCRQAPDAVVLHLATEPPSPNRLARVIRHSCPRLVGVHAPADADAAAAAHAAGFDAVVPTSRDLAFLIEQLQDANRASAVDRVHSRSATRCLTRRQMEVLRLVGCGLTSAQISDRLGIATKTVVNHKQRIFAALGVQNQAHAVAVAARQGALEELETHAGR